MNHVYTVREYPIRLGFWLLQNNVRFLIKLVVVFTRDIVADGWDS